MANPVLGRTFDRVEAGEETMTLGGVVNRSFMLLAILFLGAFYAWKEYFTGGAGAEAAAGNIGHLIMLGLFGGLGAFAVIWIFPRSVPIMSPVYAAFEGLLIGGISAFYEARYPGIVMPAVGLTLSATLAILFLYRIGVIRVTQTFVTVIMTMMGALCLFYLGSIIASFWDVQFPLIFSSGPYGIAFSLFVVGLASFSLAIDFEMIKQRIEARDAKWVEWYCAFSLMVTLVWLYLEMLRLLSKLRSR